MGVGTGLAALHPQRRLCFLCALAEVSLKWARGDRA